MGFHRGSSIEVGLWALLSEAFRHKSPVKGNILMISICFLNAIDSVSYYPIVETSQDPHVLWLVELLAFFLGFFFKDLKNALD